MEYFSVIIISVIMVLVLAFVIWWISTSNDFKRKSIKIGEALSGIEVAIGDSVMMVVTRYAYERKMVYGKILSKL